MHSAYDVVVIGAGPAGENVAARAVQGGLTAAIVERDLVGGECSYWGCMPSKALLRPGEALAAARRVPGAAEAVTGTVDLDAAISRRDAMTSDRDDKYQVLWLESEDIDLFRGHARLTGARTVTVEASSGEVQTLEARRAVVIATGTGAAMPNIPGLRESGVWNNRDVTEASTPPRRMIVLGGGVIGVEMAQAWKRLGSDEVTIVEMQDHLVPVAPAFAATELAGAFEKEGISVRTSTRATQVRRDGETGALHVTVESETGPEEIEADEVLVAVGRVPNTRDIGLETVGVEPGTWLDVDDHLRVRGVDGDWLYAVGDVNGRALLTHQGKYQARIAGDVILGKDTSAWADDRAVPAIVYTDPAIAMVGLDPEAARARGMNVRVLEYDTGGVAGSALLGKGIKGTSKLVVDSDRDVIVGATFTGPSVVGEMLHAATIAIVGEVPLEKLWHAVPAFPSVSEVWLRLLEADGR